MQQTSQPSSTSTKVDLGQGFVAKLSDFSDPSREPGIARRLMQLQDLKGRARCLCKDPNPELYVRRGGGHRYLVKMPGTTAMHALDCHFATSPGLSVGAKTGKAIVQRGETFWIRLRNGLTSSEAASAAVGQGAHVVSNPRFKRASTTVQGVLEWLWEAASVNVWKAQWQGRRNWHSVCGRLESVLSNTRFGKAYPKDLCLIVDDKAYREPVDQDMGKAWARLREDYFMRLKRAHETSGRFFVIGRISELVDRRVHLWGLGNVSFFLPYDQQSANEIVDRLVGMEGAGTVVMLLVEAKPRKGQPDVLYGVICAAGALHVSAAFIPVESTYELAMARRLESEGRSFAKPMRLHDEQYLPDFVLNDLKPEVYCEVLGMMNFEPYRLHAEEKIASYASEGRQYWLWDVSRGSMPELPAPARS